VLSKNRGNYPGLFNSDFNIASPNLNASFDLLEMTVNSDGLLPNDRTHSFKLAGSYRVWSSLMAAATFLWQTGTPLSVFRAASPGPPFFNFAQERGTAGRTPSIWDLNLRFTYDVASALGQSWRSRLVLDIFHLASQRRAVAFDQIQYYGQDEEGNPTNPNPTYGMPTRFQPATAVRLGFEVLY
jgi:hypothetical protein